MYCLTAWGQWAVELLQCTASLPGGSGQFNSCNTLPHCLGAVGSGTLAMRGPTSWGDTESCPGGGCCLKTELSQAVSYCLAAVGSATPTMHYLTARGNWAVELLSCTVSIPGGQWAVELLQCSTALPGGSGQCNSCDASPHCLGAVGSATPAMHCHDAWGQWVVKPVLCAGPRAGGTWSLAQEAVAAQRAEILSCTATPLRGSGQWNSCNARTHQLGGRGVLPRRRTLPKNGTPAMDCHTAWGRWAMLLLQCMASPPGGSG